VREYRVQLKHALWLMRLSYLCYALKAASDPRALVKKESQKPGLRPRFKYLLQGLVFTSALRISHSRCKADSNT
jgi:hypothetical protein